MPGPSKEQLRRALAALAVKLTEMENENVRLRESEEDTKEVTFHKEPENDRKKVVAR